MFQRCSCNPTPKTSFIAALTAVVIILPILGCASSEQDKRIGMWTGDNTTSIQASWARKDPSAKVQSAKVEMTFGKDWGFSVHQSYTIVLSSLDGKPVSIAYEAYGEGQYNLSGDGGLINLKVLRKTVNGKPSKSLSNATVGFRYRITSPDVMLVSDPADGSSYTLRRTAR